MFSCIFFSHDINTVIYIISHVSISSILLYQINEKQKGSLWIKTYRDSFTDCLLDCKIKNFKKFPGNKYKKEEYIKIYAQAQWKIEWVE